MHISVHMSIHISVHMSIHMSIHVSTHVHTHVCIQAFRLLGCALQQRCWLLLLVLQQSQRPTGDDMGCQQCNCLGPWPYRPITLSPCGSMAPWLCAPVAPWPCGPSALRLCGPAAPRPVALDPWPCPVLPVALSRGLPWPVACRTVAMP